MTSGEADCLTRYFVERLRDMDDRQLAVTERAMQLGLDDARGAEGRRFYADRIEAVREEMRRRLPEPQYAECPGCGGGITLEPTSNDGYAEKCTNCQATLFFHSPERSASHATR